MNLINKALEEKDGYEIKSQALEVKERLDLKNPEVSIICIRQKNTYGRNTKR